DTSRFVVAFNAEGRDYADLYDQIRLRTDFLGFTETESHCTIFAILGPYGLLDSAESYKQIDIILYLTPFDRHTYGQFYDSGDLYTEAGHVNVDDTRKHAPNLYVHRGTVEEGFIRVGELVHARIDSERRQQIRRNHTATHLLHKALRVVLGEDVRQAGSLVAPDRLRFDFTSMEPVEPQQLQSIVRIVNNEIAVDTPVETAIMDQQEALQSGAMA